MEYSLIRSLPRTRWSSVAVGVKDRHLNGHCQRQNNRACIPTRQPWKCCLFPLNASSEHSVFLPFQAIVSWSVHNAPSYCDPRCPYFCLFTPPLESNPFANMSNDPNSLPEVWSADRLMGKQVAFKGVGENGTTSADDAPPSPRRRKPKVDAAKIDPMLWGRPGHLTESDYQVFVSGR